MSETTWTTYTEYADEAHGSGAVRSNYCSEGRHGRGTARAYMTYSHGLIGILSLQDMLLVILQHLLLLKSNICLMCLIPSILMALIAPPSPSSSSHLDQGNNNSLTSNHWAELTCRAKSHACIINTRTRAIHPNQRRAKIPAEARSRLG